MKVIICGAGQVGYNIARQLSVENNNVVVIDQQDKLVRQVTDQLDVTGITGHASLPDTLRRAGAADAEMIIAVTHSDEVNMIACQVAHSLFSVPRKIARVRAQSYLKPEWQDMFRREHMPIDVTISPEVEVAKSVLRRLKLPGTFEVQPFLDERVMLVGVKLDERCPLLHTPLRQLTELFPDLQAIVMAYVREGQLHVPSSEDQLFAGDEIIFAASNEHLQRTLALFGHEESEVRRVIIVGGGNVGLSVAEAIEKAGKGVRARLIERNINRAEHCAEMLKKTIVLNGDGLDSDILTEANVQESEAIVTLTDDDKSNLLAGVLARDMGCARAMALVGSSNLMRMVPTLNIDAGINPRAITVSSILQHVRRGRIRGVYSVGDGAAEVLEIQVLHTSAVVGKPLKDVNFPVGVVVGPVLRGGEILMPGSDFVLQDKDHVVIFAMKDAVESLEGLVRVSAEYF